MIGGSALKVTEWAVWWKMVGATSANVQVSRTPG
jgi:hypothetical protein